eukprot:5533049-Karenia_brevis.AAC.1
MERLQRDGESAKLAAQEDMSKLKNELEQHQKAAGDAVQQTDAVARAAQAEADNLRAEIAQLQQS